MNLVEQLRRLDGSTQTEFAEQLGVSQPAVSQYESGRRSPKLDAFVEAASRLGRQPILLPATIEPSHDRSERFSRLLHLRVANHLIRDPHRVRSIAARNLERFAESIAKPYVDEWRRLLDEAQQTELLAVLCIPDREKTGLLSSSPFAGVIADEERLQLLDQSRAE